MIFSAVVSLVNKKVETAGGILFTISLINLSSITPGPLGILPTKPNAEAPLFIANLASSKLLIQQIFTLVVVTIFNCSIKVV